MSALTAVVSPSPCSYKYQDFKENSKKGGGKHIDKG